MLNKKLKREQEQGVGRFKLGLISVEPPVYSHRALGQEVEIFRHDLPEFSANEPWVAQTLDVSVWAYGESPQAAVKNLRQKLMRNERLDKLGKSSNCRP